MPPIDNLENMLSAEYEARLHSSHFWTHELEGYAITKAWLQKTVSPANARKFPEAPLEAFVGLITNKFDEVLVDDVWPESLVGLDGKLHQMIANYHEILCDHISSKKKAAYDILPERGTAEFDALSEASDEEYEALNTVVQKALLEALVDDTEDSEQEPDLDLADLYTELCDIIREHMTEQNCDLYRKLMLSITEIVDLT